MYFYLVDLTNNISKHKIRNSFIAKIRNITKRMFYSSEYDKSLVSYIEEVIEKDEEIKIINLVKMYKNILEKKIKVSQSQLNYYLKIIIFNLNKFNLIFKDIYYYCKKNNVKIEDLYEANINSLI